MHTVVVGDVITSVDGKTVSLVQDINPGKMRFFVGNKDMAKQIASTQDIEVIIDKEIDEEIKVS